MQAGRSRRPTARERPLSAPLVIASGTLFVGERVNAYWFRWPRVTPGYSSRCSSLACCSSDRSQGALQARWLIVTSAALLGGIDTARDPPWI